MINCEDFAPRITERGHFGGPSKYEFFSEVVSAANQWMGNRTIQIINVETIVLLNGSESTSDGVYGVGTSNGVYAVTVGSGITVNCFQCMRVWYRE